MYRLDGITMRIRLATATLAVAACVGLLAGCSGGSDSTPSPSVSATPTPVDAKALGQSLDRVVFQGADLHSADGGSCLVKAVQAAGLSDDAQRVIVEANSNSLGEVSKKVAEKHPQDAELLLSPQLRTEFDACANPTVLPTGSASAQAYPSPPAVTRPPEPSANLSPAVAVSTQFKIDSVGQLTSGVKSLFQSYALDDKQKQIYELATPCLAETIFNAGFSQETLHFIAGGPPIGSGTIADHLPNEDDKAKWNDGAFTQALSDCTTSVKVN